MFNYDIGGNVVEVATNEALTQLPFNKSLIALKLTEKDAERPAVVGGLKTLDAVFKHFQPSSEVEFTREDGSTLKETVKFSQVKDFEIKSMTNRSPFLSEIDFVRDFQLTILKQLRQNKQLAKVMENPETKSAFIDVLKALAAKLEDAK